MYIKGGALNLTRSLIDEGHDGVLADGAIVNISNSTFSRSQVHNTTIKDPLLYVRNNSVLRMNHVTLGDREPWVAYDSTVDVTNSVYGRCVVVNSSWLRDLNNFSWSNDPVSDCLHNFETNLFLEGLGDNGGPTKTHALSYGSAAINAGDQNHCLAVDQRGMTRGSACDAGAYEVTDIADVEIDLQRVTPLPWGTGQEVRMNLVLRNNGPGLATLLDLDLSILGMIITDIDSFVCPSLPCVYPFISSGSQVALPIYATMNPLVGGNYELSMEAVETINSLHHDPDQSNNEDSLSGNIVASSDLEIIKTLTTSPPFFVGQSIEYQIQVNSVGGLGASGVQVTEMPDNLTITHMSGCNSVVGLVCHINAVSSAFPANITVTATVNANFFDNAATVSANEFDPNMSNNTDNTLNGGATSTADLSVSMNLLTDGPHYSDQFVQYEVTIKSGPAPATNLVLNSTYTFPGIYIGIVGCDFLPCEFSAIPANSQIVLIFSMFAPQLIPGVLETTTHSVMITAGQADPDFSNNTATITTNLIPAADLQTNLSLLTPPPYYQGQDVFYSLEVLNRGLNHVGTVNVSLSAMQNMTLNWVSGFNCNDFPCAIPFLDFDQSETIQFSARLPNVGLFDVTAAASSAYFDPLPGDNIDSSNNGGWVELLPDDLIFEDGFEVN
jgi:hypothetical protein